MRYSLLKTSDEETLDAESEALNTISTPRGDLFPCSRTCSTRDLLVALLTLILAGGLQWVWRLSSENPIPITEIARKRGIIKEVKASWDLTLGELTPFTNGTGKEMDAAWDLITAPPGKGKFLS